MIKSSILLAGFAALCAVPAVAETAMSVPVSFAGLDLTSESGKAILNRRVSQAAKSVCGTYSADNLAAQMAARKCVATTLARAQTRVAIAVAASQQGIQTAAR